MIVQTHNADLIKSIFTHPDNYPLITDDGSLPADEFEPVMGDKIYYLSMGENEGIALFYATNSASLEAHICMSPECRGKKAIEYGKEAISWIFENTDYHKINIKIPFHNKKVLHYSISVGFRYEGIDEQSHMKNGYLYDQYILGFKKVGLCQQHCQ